MKMKKYLILFYLFFGWLLKYGCVASETKLSEEMNNRWLVGKRQEVFQIAEKRLKKNPNDLSALLIKIDYEINFLKLDELKTTLEKAIAVSKTINSSEFQKIRSLNEARLNIFKESIKNITPEIIAEDKNKAYITNKPLPSLIIIQALEQDGLVPPVTEEEIQALNTPSQDHLQTNRSTSATPSNEIQHKTNQLFQPSSRSLNHQEVPLFSNRIYWVIGLVLLAVLGLVAYFFSKKRS